MAAHDDKPAGGLGSDDLALMDTGVLARQAPVSAHLDTTAGLSPVGRGLLATLTAEPDSTGAERLRGADGHSGDTMQADDYAGSQAHPDLAPHVGKTLNGAYQVTRLLGSGGMGAVYEAVQIAVDRKVAIKVLHSGGYLPPGARDRMVRRFAREAKATSRLNHPNTVRLFDFGEAEDGTLYLVLELLNGEPLGDVMQREGRLDPGRVARIGHQICRSLREAHNEGIIHRDLKPDNIFLCAFEEEDSHVKVVDFGIARMMAEGPDVTELTGTGHTLGTPRYMAPEQAMAQTIVPATDIYSLGAMLYEMLSGAPLFDAGSAMALTLKHVSEPAPLLQIPGERDDVVAAWRTILAAFLEKNPEERVRSASEAAAMLKPLIVEGSAETVVSMSPASADLQPWTARQGKDVQTYGTQPGVLATTARAKRGRGMLWAGLGVGLAAVAGLSFGLASGSESPAQPASKMAVDTTKTTAAPAGTAPETSASGANRSLPSEPARDLTSATVAAATPPAAPGKPTAPVGAEPDKAVATAPTTEPAKLVAEAATQGQPEKLEDAHLAIDSLPTRASVLRAGKVICKTKCKLDIKPGTGPEELVITRKGYQPQTIKLHLGPGANIAEIVRLKRSRKRGAAKPTGALPGLELDTPKRGNKAIKKKKKKLPSLDL